MVAGAHRLAVLLCFGCARFIGIALLVEAVLDIIAELVTGRVIHEYRKEHSQL